MKIVLLPGMDGTGELFTAFVAALPATFETQIIRYRLDRFLSYADLLEFVKSEIPATEPFVLLAESFSTPVAIQVASTNPTNLKALILCAGFATSPVKGWRRWLLSILASVIFRVPAPNLGTRLILVGSYAPGSLVGAVRAALSLVRPEILSRRLRAVLDCNVHKELSRVSVPMLYVQACQDSLVKSSSVQEILNSNPRTVLKQIEGPHLILQRKPEQAAKLISKFIKEL